MKDTKYIYWKRYVGIEYMQIDKYGMNLISTGGLSTQDFVSDIFMSDFYCVFYYPLKAYFAPYFSVYLKLDWITYLSFDFTAAFETNSDDIYMVLESIEHFTRISCHCNTVGS